MKRLLQFLPILWFLAIVGCESDTDKAINGLKEQIGQYSSEMELLQAKISEQEQEINELKNTITSYQSQNEELTQKLSDLECEVENPYPYITDTKALCLIDKAKHTLILFETNGENFEHIDNHEKIKFNDPRINTREKIISLLNETYTPKISKEIYEYLFTKLVFCTYVYITF